LNVIKNEREAKKVVENRIAERQKLENAKIQLLHNNIEKQVLVVYNNYKSTKP
jgi:hypothetical protein